MQVTFRSKDAAKIKNSRRKPTLHFFVGAKTETSSQKLSIFHYHIPNNMDMCKIFFENLAKFKMAALDRLHKFLLAQKAKLVIKNYYKQCANFSFQCVSNITYIVLCSFFCTDHRPIKKILRIRYCCFNKK